VFHGLYIGGVGYTYIDNIFNRNILPALNVGNLGVDIFVIITGYFGVNSIYKDFKHSLKRNIPLAIEVWVYSICIFVFYVIYNGGNIDISVKSVIKCLLPTTYGQYWFFTSYMLLGIFSPYLNFIIQNLDEKRHKQIIFIMLVIWSIIPTFFQATLDYNELTLFVMLYFVGAYLGKYGVELNNSKLFKPVVAVWTIVIWIMVSVISNSLGYFEDYFAIHSNYFYQSNSILTIFLAAIMVYLLAKKKWYDKRINFIAKNVFAAYLLTDHSLIRKILWIDCFKVDKYANSNLLIFYCLAVCAVLLIFGIFIESFRKKIESYILNIICHIKTSRRSK
jgi:hypothetical protein